MALAYSLLDVFADAPFQGVQIPVVLLDKPMSDAHKQALAGEFQQTETVFIDAAAREPATVFNSKGPCLFGAHTILAASYAAYEKGLVQDQGNYSSFKLTQQKQIIESHIDKAASGPGAIQFARTLSPTVDRYTPEIAQLAAALNTEERHISFSKYKPMVISVDHPVLIIPFTKPEHVQAASFNVQRWADLAGHVYTPQQFLFAPGSITGSTQFHGRLINPELGRDVLPPIGSVMPEFIAYLAEQADTAVGTHTFAIDRGSDTTRKSILHAEFDKRPGREVRCRIGGHVIKMGRGELLYP
ncbi:MAG: PhzF family phenazine biosynthesis protein [Pedobacter sp.]|nr:PhzF family phenazine biosynthesis protein [Pedobacter sp.]